MTAPTLKTPIGSKLRLIKRYEFLEEGREGILESIGRPNFHVDENVQTLLVNMGDGEFEVDSDHFDLFEVVMEKGREDAVRFVERPRGE